MNNSTSTSNRIRRTFELPDNLERLLRHIAWRLSTPEQSVTVSELIRAAIYKAYPTDLKTAKSELEDIAKQGKRGICDGCYND